MTTTERLKTPLLFPCAARVKMPQIGSEDSDLKLGQKSSRFAPDSIVFRNPTEPSDPISKDYLKKVSFDLVFEEQVVKERCFHALPYDEKYLTEAFDVGDLVALPHKTKIPVGRHNARGVDIRHMPCNLTKTNKSHLKPLKRRITERAHQMHIEALKRKELREIQRKIIEKHLGKKSDEEKEGEEPTESVFLTETKVEETSEVPKTEVTEQETVPVMEELPKTEKTVSKSSVEEVDEPEEKGGNDWDAYLMSLVSSNTANWIVYERTPAGSKEREKLENLLKKWYGVPEHTDLVREDMSDNEAESDEEIVTPKQKWKKKEATLLQKVYNLEEDTPRAEDPYSDDNKAPFYRQPAGVRRARKHEVKEELGAINTTAANIEVKTIKPAPPPTLRDFINPEAGKYVMETDNMFQQEQLTGTEQIYNAYGDKTKILMDSNNKYKKDLQQGFPEAPEKWFPLTDAERQKQARDLKKQKKYERGQKRWKKLPEPIDSETEARPYGYDPEYHREPSPRTMKAGKRNKALRRAKALPEYLLSKWWLQVKSLLAKKNIKSSSTNQPSMDTAELLSIQAPGTDNDYRRSADSRTRRTAKNNASLRQIIDEWRTKWHLSGQYADSTPEDLINDMADIQPHVRLKAIATCAKASDYKPPEDDGIQLIYQGNDDGQRDLPEKLFVALECLLDDPVEKIRTAAAITLYSLDRPSDRAQEILYSALQSDNPVDRWAAAQCLAHYGICDSDVVGEILHQVMTTEDTIKHERGINMLAILSITSNLVHAMVAEQLNSSSWRHKVIACKILPTLKGDINKDITNKLSDLMWNDWHAEVRKASAQCLGKTGHGRDVHDDLRNRILEGDERIKLEAISKVGQLGIMTAKLLPAFLKCFDDEYVAVRSEVCITCGNIAIKDEEIIAKLIHLATFDNIWKIKALAFQALGKIGAITEQIVDCLLWAVRYEENPGVRAEACHTLKVLKVVTEEVADVLQDRFLVESNPLVRDELASTLKMFDISASEDMDMIAQIKREVKKLCTRDIIASQITLNEQDQDKRENLARMIYESEKDMKEHEKPQTPMMERIRSMSQASCHKSKPGSTVTTPEPILRETVFTPTADQELEAILAKDEGASGKTSPSTSITLTKSRATSVDTKFDEEDEEEDVQIEETPEDSKKPSSAGTTSSLRRSKSMEDDRLPSSAGTRSPGFKSEGDNSTGTQEVERPTSTVKFAPHLEVADIPSRPRSLLGPSRLSLMDEHGKPSRTSVTTGTTGTEGMVFGRDAVIEREKINEEARNTFAVMDSRYEDMVQDLIDLDNAFELGLTSGSRQDFENKIQNMRIVQTPPSRKGEKPKVEIAFKDATFEKQADKVKFEEDLEMIDADSDLKSEVDIESKALKSESQSEDKLSQPEVIADKPKEKSDIEIVVTEANEEGKES